ncbi:MAG: peroxidase [Anaerolineae bacterium]
MAWIQVVPPEEATGVLKARYDAAIRRAGMIWNIVSIMSLHPKVMRASIEGMYSPLMHGPSDLTRAQREMIAVVVSRASSCHY